LRRKTASLQKSGVPSISCGGMPRLGCRESEPMATVSRMSVVCGVNASRLERLGCNDQLFEGSGALELFIVLWRTLILGRQRTWKRPKTVLPPARRPTMSRGRFGKHGLDWTRSPRSSWSRSGWLGMTPIAGALRWMYAAMQSCPWMPGWNAT